MFSEDEFIARVERIKDQILALRQPDPEIQIYLKGQAHFYSLWGYLSLTSSDQINSATLGANYTTFMSLVTRVLETDNPDEHNIILSDIDNPQSILDYASSSRGASTDLMQRTKRHNALETALRATNLFDEDH